MEKFKTRGVCSSEISFKIEDNKVAEVAFLRGCAGNAIGIGALVKGMEVNEAISRLKGIKCGSKNTSCPDQLATALENYIETH